jgi:hypothetical protein
MQFLFGIVGGVHSSHTARLQNFRRELSAHAQNVQLAHLRGRQALFILFAVFG